MSGIHVPSHPYPEQDQLDWRKERDIILRHLDDTGISTNLPKTYLGYDVYLQCNTDSTDLSDKM